MSNLLKTIQHEKHERIIDTLIFILLVAVCCGYFLINVPHSSLNSVKTFLDEYFVRMPVFSVAYLYFLPWLWITVFYLYLKKSFRQIAYALIMMNLIAFCVYAIFQTHVPREYLPDNDLFSGLLKFIYSSDQPYNGFPSLHCAMSAGLATSFVIRKSRWAWFFVVSAILIVISTLFTKQHYVLDAISGVALGVAMTWIVYKMFPVREY